MSGFAKRTCVDWPRRFFISFVDKELFCDLFAETGTKGMTGASCCVGSAQILLF